MTSSLKYKLWIGGVLGLVVIGLIAGGCPPIQAGDGSSDGRA